MSARVAPEQQVATAPELWNKLHTPHHLQGARELPETTSSNDGTNLVTGLLTIHNFQVLFPATTDKLLRWRERQRFSEARAKRVMRTQRALFNEHGLVIAPADHVMHVVVATASIDSCRPSFCRRPASSRCGCRSRLWYSSS